MDNISVDNMDEMDETKSAIIEAQEKLKQLSDDKHERELADLREKYILDQNSIERTGYIRGKSDGFAEGENCKKIEIAKKMLENKLDIDIIIQCTGLTKEEIENIK